MIIDCHAHLETRLLSVDRAIEKMDAAGVDKVVFIPALNDLLPPTPEGLLDIMRVTMRRRATRPIAEAIHRATLDGNGNLRFPRFPLFERVEIYQEPDNESVARILRAHPDRFLGWIFLNPTPGGSYDPHVLDKLERWRSVPGFIGVKLHPHWHDYRTDVLGPILRRCEELRLPVLMHLGFRSRGDFRSMASTYPKHKLIAAHAGFPFYDDLWRYAGAYPNLMVDLSSPYINESLAREAVEAMGPERCLYGTDAPYGEEGDDGLFDYTAIRGWIDRLPVNGRKRDWILGEGFQSLIER